MQNFRTITIDTISLSRISHRRFNLFILVNNIYLHLSDYYYKYHI